MTTLTVFENPKIVSDFQGCWFQPWRLSLSLFCNQLRLLLNSAWCLMFCKAVILVVSAYDIYLTVKYVEFLPQMELNPLGRWFLGLDHGPTCCLQQAAAFITAKFTGNVLVVVAIELLASFGFRLVGIVAAAVAFFQVLLGFFLFFAGFIT